jgi:iron complex outermembrane receptor protein
LKKQNRWLYITCAGSLLMSGGGHAFAQTQSVAPADASAAGLEEIVVTAQKRSEKLQNVPISINAFTANYLSEAGIENPADLGQIAPGLSVVVNSNALLPFLRGVGNPASTLGNEASVAMYVDDVYIARLDASSLELANLDRIEVLKGPQGTLFGRNSSGGVIAIYTKNPTQDPTLDVTVGYGNYDTQTVKLYGSIGLTDGIAADISVYHVNQGEGWGRNFANGQKFGYQDSDTIRSKWIFDISDDATLRVIANYTHGTGDAGNFGTQLSGTTRGFETFYSQPPYNFPVTKITSPGFYNVNDFVTNVDRNESASIQGRFDYDFNFAKFSSISSFRNATENNLDDGDYTPVDSLIYRLLARDRTFTQEFQLASEDAPFDWVAGFYYLNAFAGYEPTNISGQGVGPNILGGALGPCVGCTVNLNGQQRIEDYAGYGQATFHVLENTNLTLGVRYTVDDVQGFGSTEALVPGLGTITFPGTARREQNFYKPTFKVALDQHFTDDIMGYMSFSRGFKAGTFNTLPLGARAVAPEVIDAYEIGVKSELLDRRLQLNGSFFFYQITNPQVQEIINQLVALANAGAAQIKGVDLDGQYKIIDGLVARFGAEYLDAHYTSFPSAPCIFPNPNPPYGAFQPVSCNAAGHDLPHAPRYSLNIGLHYDMATNIGGFAFDTSYAWNSGIKFDPDGFVAQRSYGLLDASVVYTLPDDDQWQFRLWGKNLTQTRYILSDLENSGPAGYTYAPGAPATFGIQAEYKFGGSHEATGAAQAAYTPPAAVTPAPSIPKAYLVFFDFNKSELTPQAVQIVDTAAKSAGPARVTQLTVTGHTDTVGSDAYNMRLSRRRAESVAAQLEKDGIASSEIEIVAKGKRDLLVPTGDGVREPQNRRVQIVFDGGPTS